MAQASRCSACARRRPRPSVRSRLRDRQVYPDAVRQVRTALGSFSNLDLLGRGGRFWYSHLHDQMRAAKDYVRSLVEARLTTERVPAHPKVGDEAVPWASFS